MTVCSVDMRHFTCRTTQSSRFHHIAEKLLCLTEALFAW